MSFGTDGFLCDAFASGAVQHFRKEHAAWFEQVWRLNRTAQAMLVTTTLSRDRSLLIMMQFFARVVSNFQAAVLLAERGMTVEARILTRSCLESVFAIGAISNDPGFVDTLVAAARHHQRNIAKWVSTADPTMVGFTQDQLDGFNAFLDELEKSGVKVSRLILQEAANSADMHDLYETLYRELSNGAAHPTLEAVEGFLDYDADGNIIGLQLGSPPKDIEQTLSVAETAMFSALSFMLGKFPNQAVEDEMNACWENHKKLAEALNARERGPHADQGSSARNGV